MEKRILGLRGRSYIQAFWDNRVSPPSWSVWKRMDNRESGASPGIHWYAVSTKSRHEKVASTMLDAIGIEHFLPLYEEERSWSDRKQLVQLPLFPGYLFVRIDPLSGTKLQVLKAPGVARFVGNQYGPLAIPDGEVEAIQTLVARGAGLSPHPFLESGDRVRVVRGSLAGVEGKIVRGPSASRLVISIEAIQRSIAVQVAIHDVVLLGNQATDGTDGSGDVALTVQGSQYEPGHDVPIPERLCRSSAGAESSEDPARSRI